MSAPNTGWPAGYALRWLETTDSTNEEGHRHARAGDPAPVWIAAKRQRAGRGRRGRSWDGGQGNLLCSLLLDWPGTPGRAAQLGFVTSLALCDSVGGVAPGVHVALKWPNDVLLGSAKLGGILVETGATKARNWVAVGIGVNLATAPAGTEFPAVALSAAFDPPPSPEAMLVRLAGQWAAWYEIWQKRGFAPLRQAWLTRHAAEPGAVLKARLANGEVQEGVFEDLDPEGALVLRQPDGRRHRVTAAEIFFAG